jgi:phosphatidylinositol alpha 1,6-mannosyltransferase
LTNSGQVASAAASFTAGTAALRVAFFPDAYDEVDGVANTARQFEAFARRRELPLLTVCGGERNCEVREGTGTRLMLRRGPIGFAVDERHDFDLGFWRHYSRLEAEVREFDADIVHITGPSDVGQLGALVAHKLGVPLSASWHTNLHEYAEQRTTTILSWLPASLRVPLGSRIRQTSLRALLRFYKIAQLLFAPNAELINLVEKGTGKACYSMPRGVDTVLFDPERRSRRDNRFVIGYVGRLTTEKNIRCLVDLEKALIEAGLRNFRFTIVGQGAERAWLQAQMRQADFTGVLRGEQLAEAYANMDVFVFPSRTDTYGNVVLEALASGVPAMVSDSGGPRFIVGPGETGFVAKSLADFVNGLMLLASQPELLKRMRCSGRKYALTASWDSLFESLYARYDQYLRLWSRGKQILGLPGIARPSNLHQTS